MLDLRAQYLARFGAIKPVAQAIAHDGELDDDEVERIGVARTPAVILTCLGMAGVLEDSGPTAAWLRWVAVVIARAPDSVRASRASAGDVAALIALRVVHELAQGDPFAAALERAADVRAQNLVGTRAARKGYVLWAVTWRQPTEIRPAELDAVLDEFGFLHTDIRLAPVEEGDPVDTSTDLDLRP